jgi:hypothetical protein
MSMAFSTPDSKPTHLHPRSEKDSSSLPTVAKRACFEEAAQQLEDKSGESRLAGFSGSTQVRGGWAHSESWG